MGEQSVAVGRGGGDGAGADGAARAGAVVDHDGLADLRGHLLEHDARDDVDRAACGERHDDADRPGRPLLRGGGPDRQQGDGSEAAAAQNGKAAGDTEAREHYWSTLDPI